METYYRKLTDEEIDILKNDLTNIWKLLFEDIMKWFFISLLTLIPLLIFYFKMSDIIKLIYLATDQLLVILLIFNFSDPFEKIRTNKKIKKALLDGTAEVTRIKASKAIVRPSENTSPGYYLDIGNNKTIFLQNEYFERLYFRGKFPNTEFEKVKTAINKIYVNTITLGKQILIERQIRTFKEQYATDDMHKDGQILEMPIDNIK